MIFYDETDKLHEKVKPLTRAERRWLDRLEKVLKSCPSDRLELVTIGDPSLNVIDGNVMRDEDIEIHDGNAYRAGIVLAVVEGDVSVHGVSG